MEAETQTTAPAAEPQFTFIDEGLDNGGVTEDQVRAWEEKHPLGVWHVRIPFPDTSSALARFPDAPLSDGLVIRQYHVECWLRSPSIEDAYRILELAHDPQAKDEFALNLLWLGGSRLIENPDDPRKIDEAMRLAVLMRIVPQVASAPLATLKKSSLLSPTRKTTRPGAAQG